MLGTVSDIEESVAPLQPVFVTLLTARDSEESAGNAAKPFEATLLGLHGRELELAVPCIVAIHAPLKVESPEAIWLGTVESCHPAAGDAANSSSATHPLPEKKWTVSVSVSRVLKDFDTLERLAILFGSRPAFRLRVLRRAIIQV